MAPVTRQKRSDRLTLAVIVRGAFDLERARRHAPDESRRELARAATSRPERDQRAVHGRARRPAVTARIFTLAG